VHLWKSSSIYGLFVYAHIQKRAYTEDAYIAGAYMKEIYCNPNASSVYACFHICAFKKVVVHKSTFICIICICAYTEAHIYERCHYGHGQLWYMHRPYMHIYGSHRLYMCRPYMHIYGSMHIGKVHIWMTHIQKVHIRNFFMVIQMHIPYMCAFIYAHLRKLSSVNAHLYASSVYVHIQKTPLWKWSVSIYASSIYAHLQKSVFVYVSFVYVHIRKCAYTEGAYIDNAYTEGAYTEEIYSNPNAYSRYVCFHI
jgi:hypothetical protein